MNLETLLADLLTYIAKIKTPIFVPLLRDFLGISFLFPFNILLFLLLSISFSDFESSNWIYLLMISFGYYTQKYLLLYIFYKKTEEKVKTREKTWKAMIPLYSEITLMQIIKKPIFLGVIFFIFSALLFSSPFFVRIHDFFLEKILRELAQKRFFNYEALRHKLVQGSIFIIYSLLFFLRLFFFFKMIKNSKTYFTYNSK